MRHLAILLLSLAAQTAFAEGGGVIGGGGPPPTTNSVPEPGTWTLILIGAAAAWRATQRRR